MQPLPAWSGVDHYENFPVASRLLPARLRPAVIAIYRFARFADDLADEGDLSTESRLAGLDGLREALLAGPGGRDAPEVVKALWPHVNLHQIPLAPLLDLLSAFTQDASGFHYETREDLLDYCRRSANPVGRLMLHLFGIRHDPLAIEYSDAICSALQLINFAQDLAIDVKRGRIYLPADRLAAEGVSPAQLDAAVLAGRAGPSITRLIASECRWARRLIDQGRPLVRRVPLRLSLELRAILAGGTRILDRLERAGYDPIQTRPTLGPGDALPLIRLFAGAAR